MHMKVLVLHTRPPHAVGNGREVSEFDLLATAHGVADALPHAAVVSVRGDAAEIMQAIASRQPDVVFNLCEAPLGQPALESHVAALLEWMGVRFTGSSSETLALCRRKDRTNAVLTAAGIPTPRTGVFPCIVKPTAEDGSAGIDGASICDDARAVERATARVSGPVVIEEFLPGREFAVTVWGRRAPDHISIGETRFLNGLRLITYAAKWDPDSADFANSPLEYDMTLESALRDAIVAVSQHVWRAVHARGYLRIDIRLNALALPCVIDVNPNPELGPGVGARRAVQEAGWSWTRFVQHQVEWA